MPKTSKSIFVPVSKPRNQVVRALIGKFNTGAGRHKDIKNKRADSRKQSSLAESLL